MIITKKTKTELELMKRRTINKAHPRGTTARMQEFNSMKLIQATFTSLTKLGGMVATQIPKARFAHPEQFKQVAEYTAWFHTQTGNAVLKPLLDIGEEDLDVQAKREAEYQRLHGDAQYTDDEGNINIPPPPHKAPSTPPTPSAPIKSKPPLKPGDFDVDEVVAEMVDLLANNQIPKQTPEQRQAFLAEQKAVQELTEELRRGNEAMQSRSVIIGPGNALYDALSAKETPEEAADWERRHNEALARWERGERDVD